MWSLKREAYGEILAGMKRLTEQMQRDIGEYENALESDPRRASELARRVNEGLDNVFAAHVRHYLLLSEDFQKAFSTAVPKLEAIGADRSASARLRMITLFEETENELEAVARAELGLSSIRRKARASILSRLRRRN